MGGFKSRETFWFQYYNWNCYYYYYIIITIIIIIIIIHN